MNRAITLLYADKVVPFEVLPDEWLHGPERSDGTRFSMQVPVSVYLKKYRYIEFKDIAPVDDVMAGRMAVLHRDGFQCAYCLAPASTIDHLHPQSKGGTNMWENLVAACTFHNQLKADMPLKDFLEKYDLRLLKKPFIPKREKYVREQESIWDKLSSGVVDIPEELD